MRRFVQLFSFLLLATKRPYKYKKSSKIDGKFVKVKASENSAEQISKDIDRLFPNHKEGGSFIHTGIWIDEYTNTSKVVKGNQGGMVLEKGNFDWTPEELAVARAKGIIVNQ
tara:strand:+ start:605 stop:940 length:336 start_codon:yes stop_codon:yes gene_type:complete